MRLATFSALPQELRSSLHNLGARKVSGTHPFPFFSAHYSSCEILFVQTGIGLRNAEAALKYTLQEHRPDFVLSVGFGGALYGGADIGDLIWPSRVLLVDGGVTETIVLSGAVETADKVSKKVSMREGSLLSLARRIKKSEINKALFRELPFPVCDMETFTMAKMSVESGLPFFSIRSITDLADEEIPPAFFDVVDESGTYRLSRALMLLLRNPRLLPDSIKLGRSSRIASRNLWHAVRYLIETL